MVACSFFCTAINIQLVWLRLSSAYCVFGDIVSRYLCPIFKSCHLVTCIFILENARDLSASAGKELFIYRAKFIILMVLLFITNKIYSNLKPKTQCMYFLDCLINILFVRYILDKTEQLSTVLQLVVPLLIFGYLILFQVLNSLNKIKIVLINVYLNFIYLKH